MVHQPAPCICDRLGRFSQREINQTAATRSTTPPPKKPAAGGISCNGPRTSSAIPTTVKITPENFSRSDATALRFRCAVAPLRERSSLETTPANKLLVDALRSLRNVKKMHATAANTPPTAPATNHNHETCSRRSVVPTASTHHVLSPYINSAAYAIDPTSPNKLPTPASSVPSIKNSRRIPLSENPSACNVPISRARCSIPSLKKSVVSISAATTRKKLKYKKYSPKSVAPREADSP